MEWRGGIRGIVVIGVRTLIIWISLSIFLLDIDIIKVGIRNEGTILPQSGIRK
jgi:hypothetical protein